MNSLAIAQGGPRHSIFWSGAAWIVHVGRAAIGGAGAAAAVFGFLSIGAATVTVHSHWGVHALDLLGSLGAILGGVYGIIVESRLHRLFSDSERAKNKNE
jgi:hypothetical protein